MPILSPYNGLQFQIIKLDGCLTVTLSLNGKRASKLEISYIDTSVKEEPWKSSGAQVTAVGLEMLLIKNNGTLELEYVGDTGASGSWRFNGLDHDEKSMMVATAGMQTEAPNVKEVEVQTERAILKEVNVQTETVVTKALGVQTDRPVVYSTSTQTERSTSSKSPNRAKKRKLSPKPYVPNNRAKSTTSSAPWPKHLFMECCRTVPAFKGPQGILHLDLELAEVWFNGSYGGIGAKCIEKKQVNLQDETSKYL
jgi:hypothetical protein